VAEDISAASGISRLRHQFASDLHSAIVNAQATSPNAWEQQHLPLRSSVDHAATRRDAPLSRLPAALVRPPGPLQAVTWAGIWTTICLGWVLWFWATRSSDTSSVALGGTVLVVAVVLFLALTWVAVVVVWISPRSPRVFRWGVTVPGRVAAVGVGVMAAISFLGSRPRSLDVPVGLWLVLAAPGLIVLIVKAVEPSNGKGNGPVRGKS
jgi:hypothetical protein